MTLQYREAAWFAVGAACMAAGLRDAVPTLAAALLAGGFAGVGLWAHHRRFSNPPSSQATSSAAEPKACIGGRACMEGLCPAHEKVA